MPTTPTYPGVYIEEVPSGVRTISGVATSIATFVDFFARGPMNRAIQLFNMGDFEREFGGLDTRSEASYGISQFFLNGGGEAWVVRVASGNAQNPLQKATAVLRDGVGSGAGVGTALTISATSEGRWGNALHARVDSGPGNTFDLTLTEYVTEGGVERPARTETHRGLSMSASSPREVERVVNEETNLALNVTIGTTAARAEFERPAGVTSVPLPVAARMLEEAIRTSRPADPAFAGATVGVFGGNR